MASRVCDGSFSKQFCVRTVKKKSRVCVNLITDVRATTSFAFATDHCFCSECNTGSGECSKPLETTITFPFDLRIKKSKEKGIRVNRILRATFLFLLRLYLTIIFYILRSVKFFITPNKVFLDIAHETGKKRSVKENY